MDITPTRIALLVLALATFAVAVWMARRAKPVFPKAAEMKRKATARRAPVKPPAGAGSPAPKRPSLGALKSWGYQLQHLDVAEAAASPFDLLVIDATRDGSDETHLTPPELARLQTKPDGSRRIVLAYLSIGEAEDYRGYWNPRWKAKRPDWLLAENPEWKGNYAVCFWDTGWQSIMCGGPEARLDRIIAAGFDGVYLDKCDVYEDLRRIAPKVAKSRPKLEADMVAFIVRLSGYAKARRPDFAVIMQNTEALIDEPGLLATIDGVAKEELVFGIDAPERRNSQSDITWSIGQLEKAKRAGKSILCVEYLDNPEKIAVARALIEAKGFVPYISQKDRELDRLVVPV